MIVNKTKLCEVCNQAFQPTNNRQKYCPECRKIKEDAARAKARRGYEEREREYKKTMAVHHWGCAVEVKDKTGWHVRKNKEPYKAASN